MVEVAVVVITPCAPPTVTFSSFGPLVSVFVPESSAGATGGLVSEHVPKPATQPGNVSVSVVRRVLLTPLAIRLSYASVVIVHGAKMAVPADESLTSRARGA